MKARNIPEPRFIALVSKLESYGFEFIQAQKPRASKIKYELTFQHPRLLARFSAKGLYTRTKVFYLRPIDETANSSIAFSAIDSSPLHTQSEIFPKPNHENLWVDLGIDALLAAIDDFLIIEQQESTESFYQEVEKALSDSTTTRQARLLTANKKPKRVKTTTWTYNRNPDVVAEVLAQANGRCQKCLNKAPFRRKSDNTPYLEVHHKVFLSNGGEDTVENSIALCPNCHRELHFGE
ncbi:HNH endonuclease [Vibrio alginolyticus]|uniref:HNH endonuclease n=1 Tax=Vibrio alginolyticus TaxID=663 RepID=UPI00215BA775|nr:HNH endonuclease [Vibrio alginolyticus]EJG0029148.1 HNH endonuclease [Vibrio alginolyticus]MCR9506743.1 HNH endonuclease [Vibrio alginolyticus]